MSAPMTSAWRNRFALLRAGRVADGLCERCGEPSRPDRVQCAACAEARRAALVDSGRCIACEELARPDRLHCWPCGAKANEAAIARYRARTGGTRRHMRCGICKAEGHDRRRCGEPR